MSQLEEEQKRTDELIYQLLPRSVAEKLRLGESVLSTCEVIILIISVNYMLNHI